MIKLILRLVLIYLTVVNICWATPSEIFIIRHADKLDQPNPGPALSAKGLQRSLKLANYFLAKFGDLDFIIATDPIKNSTSFRELQTIAPLSNMISEKHPNDNVPILHFYTNKEYSNLAKDLLTNNEFAGKKILVCWDHEVIPKLAKLLGVKESIPKWPKQDFDSVYVINYDAQGNVSKFTVLNNQYPVGDVTWSGVSAKFNSQSPSNL